MVGILRVVGLQRCLYLLVIGMCVFMMLLSSAAPASSRRLGLGDRAGRRDAHSGALRLQRELEYRIPRLHSPVNSRRFPETFGDFCKTKTTFLLVFVETKGLRLKQQPG